MFYLSWMPIIQVFENTISVYYPVALLISNRKISIGDLNVNPH